MPVEPVAASVIMPCRNGAAVIEAQLAALHGQDYDGPWELIVADNGSTDETPPIVAGWRRRMPWLRWCKAGTVRGANHARNAGCAAAHGDLLLFCDADDVVDSGWVRAMVQGLGRYPAVGGFVERRALNDDAALAARPERPGLLDGGFGFLRYPLTANCGVRRSVWSTVGGFDSRYRYGSDDVEFFWRVQLAGYRLGYLPDAVVHYRLHTGLRGMARQYYLYGRTHVQLFRDFAGAGMPATDPCAVARAWTWLLTHAPDLARSRSHRAVWLTRAALRCGRLTGSLQHRIGYL